MVTPKTVAKKTLLVGVNVLALVCVAVAIVSLTFLLRPDKPDATQARCAPARPTTAQSQAQRARLVAARQGLRAARLARPVDTARVAAAKQRLARVAPRSVALSASSQGLTFGHAVNTQPRTVAFATTRDVRGVRALKVEPLRLHPQTGESLIGSGAVLVWARLGENRHSATAYVCLVPGTRAQQPSGVFTGTVRIRDPRLRATNIPVTVSLSDTNADKVLLAGLVVCLLASFYVFFLRQPDIHAAETVVEGQPPKAPAEAVFRWPFTWFADYWLWITSVGGVFTITAGLVGAWTAFKVQYLNADAWSSDFPNLLTFAAAVATAFVTAGTVGKIAQNIYKK